MSREVVGVSLWTKRDHGFILTHDRGSRLAWSEFGVEPSSFQTRSPIHAFH